MQISWHGATCFSIVTKTATLVTDPATAVGGIPKADIVLLSRADAAAGTAESTVDWPGEYELRDVFVVAVPAFPATDDLREPPTLFVLETDNVSIGFFAGITGKLTPEQVDQLGEVDVLLLPVGANGLDPATAKAVLEQVDPRVLIPSGDDATARQQLIESLGLVPEDGGTDVKLEERDLPVETMRLIQLSPKA